MHATLVPRSWRSLLAAALGAAVLVVAPTARAVATGAPPTPTWSVLSPPTPGPALRGAAAAYDGANGTVVVFGGLEPDGTLSNRTWVWDGTSWSAAHLSRYSTPPPARMDAALAYDASLNQLILFGGQAQGGTLLDDTWLWNGESWIQVNAPATPGARADAALAPDPHGRLLLFGGYGTSNAPVAAPPPATTTTTTPPPTSSSTTTPSSTAGTSTTTSTAPSAPVAPAATVVPGAPSPGSTGAGTATATGSRTASAQRITPAGHPRQAHRHLTTPTLLDDTWVLESTPQGDNWSPVQTPVHPTARLGASMVSEGGRTVLFGGTTSTLEMAAGAAVPGTSAVGDTWSWGGSSWRLLRTTGAPPARAGAVAADDQALGTLILFGGTGPHGLLDDVWALEGVAWRRLATSPPPAARYGAVGVYDIASRQLVVLGGTGVGGRPVAGTVVLTPRPPVRVTTTPPTTPGAPTTLPPRGGTSGAGGSTVSSVTSRPPAATRPPLSTVTTRVHPGDVVTLYGHGFIPHARVRITFGAKHQLVAVTTANASGEFRVDVTVPDTRSIGTHEFEAVGQGPHGRVRLLTPVRVASYTSRPGPTPAETAGLVLIALALPAATLLAMGAASRVRRRRATA